MPASGAWSSGATPPPHRRGVQTPRTAHAVPQRHCACGSGSEVSRRNLLEHVDVEGLVSHQLLEPGVLGFELFEPFGLVGLHTAVLGHPAVPRRFRNLQVPAHLRQLLASPQEFVALGELADDLVRGVTPALVRSHVVVDSSCPNTRATESHNHWTTAGGSPHYRSDDVQKLGTRTMPRRRDLIR